ncbi:hypothetical protein P3T23_002630 [Paraburkholderia sp. GAS448]
MKIGSSGPRRLLEWPLVPCMWSLTARRGEGPKWVDHGRSRQTEHQSNVSMQANAFDGALPLARCVNLFCRKISGRIALRCVCVELYFSEVSARVSPGS